MTQVLPQTSAGKSFQTGDGHGEVPRRDEADDAYGHADAHGELVLQLGGRGLAEEAAAFAGDVEGLIDGFLHVAAGFGQHFAHFAGHVAGVLLFALLQKDAGADEDLGALGRGNAGARWRRPSSRRRRRRPRLPGRRTERSRRCHRGRRGSHSGWFCRSRRAAIRRRSDCEMWDRS